LTAALSTLHGDATDLLARLPALAKSRGMVQRRFAAAGIGTDCIPWREERHGRAP